MQISDIKTTFLERIEPQLRPVLDNILDRWENLNAREQLIVILLGVTILIALFTSLLVVPLLKERATAKNLYEAHQEELTWMRSVAPKVISSGSKAPVLNAQSMMNTVNKSAAGFQLKLNRVQPEGNSKLRVWLENVPFNSVMRWINDLQVESGIVASSVNIEAESAPGLVSVKVVLQGQ